jgi:hypothetical protein
LPTTIARPRRVRPGGLTPSRKPRRWRALSLVPPWCAWIGLAGRRPYGSRARPRERSCGRSPELSTGEGRSGNAIIHAAMAEWYDRPSGLRAEHLRGELQEVRPHRVRRPRPDLRPSPSRRGAGKSAGLWLPHPRAAPPRGSHSSETCECTFRPGRKQGPVTPRSRLLWQ